MAVVREERTAMAEEEVPELQAEAAWPSYWE